MEEQIFRATQTGTLDRPFRAVVMQRHYDDVELLLELPNDRPSDGPALVVGGVYDVLAQVSEAGPMGRLIRVSEPGEDDAPVAEGVRAQARLDEPLLPAMESYRAGELSRETLVYLIDHVHSRISQRVRIECLRDLITQWMEQVDPELLDQEDYLAGRDECLMWLEARLVDAYRGSNS